MKSFLSNNQSAFWKKELAIWILRSGVGALFVWHGVRLLLGGATVWRETSESFCVLGLCPTGIAVGLLAGVVEALCGILLVLGYLTNFAALFLLLEMLAVLFVLILREGEEVLILYVIKDLFVFVAILLFGPGVFSVDARRQRHRSESPVSSGEEA